MAQLIPDTLDWAAYERDTDARVKVRAASAFRDDVVGRFAPKQGSTQRAEMFSTKLAGRIEFRPGEITAWAGYNGHRKSMFIGQVMLDLCVQRQRTLIASMEMYPADTLARMVRQAVGTARPAQKVIEGFSRWSDGRLWLFDHVGRVSPAVMAAVVRYFADELKGQQVLIDSMMMVCASEESLDEQKQFVTDLVRIAQETQVHIHLVCHCRKPQAGEDRPPTKYDLRGSAAISDQAHNVVIVWANKPKRATLERSPADEKALGEPDQVVAVEKQRNGEWEGRAGLWFDPASMRFVDSADAPVRSYAFVEEIAP